ncbi:MAG: transporter substrate-binding domain-containing protein [Marinobacter sp.]|uniref:substrate-binding periplasmic protein n=1 Tax=Marinobacter sp. TaxID=50741 RepID=UPI00396E0472
MRKVFLIILTLFLSACSPEQPPRTPIEQIQPPASPKIDTANPENRIVVLAADPWCPHNCVSGSTPEGYMVDLAREALGLAGFEVSYVNMSWARALEQARTGYIDGIIGPFTSDAPEFIFPEEHMGTSHVELYTQPGQDWRYEGIDSLRNQALIALNGYSYSPELDDYILRNRDDQERVWILSGPAPLERAIKLILEGRSDVLPEDRDVMAWTLKNQLPGVQLRNAGALYKTPVYIAFSAASPRSEELADTLSRGIRELRASGRLTEILAGYGVSPVD